MKEQGVPEDIDVIINGGDGDNSAAIIVFHIQRVENPQLLWLVNDDGRIGGHPIRFSYI